MCVSQRLHNRYLHLTESIIVFHFTSDFWWQVERKNGEKKTITTMKQTTTHKYYVCTIYFCVMHWPFVNLWHFVDSVTLRWQTHRNTLNARCWSDAEAMADLFLFCFFLSFTINVLPQIIIDATILAVCTFVIIIFNCAVVKC